MPSNSANSMTGELSSQVAASAIVPLANRPGETVAAAADTPIAAASVPVPPWFQPLPNGLSPQIVTRWP
jgi:hypothetical protein